MLAPKLEDRELDLAADPERVALLSYDAIVLGAGVSGLTAAATLTAQGAKVCVLDSYPEAGGNHISRDFGPYTFDIGTIFFHETNPLFRLFPAMRSACVPMDYHIQRITPFGRILKYPFDAKTELVGRGAIYAARVALQLLAQRVLPRRRSSAADFCRYHLGDLLLRDSGLDIYLKRFYGIPTVEISYSFARKRMSWVAQNTRLRTIAARLARRVLSGPAPEDPLSYLARPREGFPALYRFAATQLREAGVDLRLGVPILSAAYDEGRFEVRTPEASITAARLISTIPMEVAAGLFSVTVDRPPRSSALVTLCCRFQGRRNFTGVVLFNFRDQGAWKRLTVHSQYYGAVDGWDYFSVEIVETDGATDPDRLFDDFKSSIVDLDILDGAIELVGSFRTEFAYPVYDLEAEARRDRLGKSLAALRIELIGRQGTFDYIQSSRLAVELAEAALK